MNLSFWEGFEKKAISAELAMRAAQSALNKRNSVFAALDAAGRKLLIRDAKKAAGGKLSASAARDVTAKRPRTGFYLTTDKFHVLRTTPGVEKVLGHDKTHSITGLAYKRDRQQQKFMRYARRKVKDTLDYSLTEPDKKLKAILEGK